MNSWKKAFLNYLNPKVFIFLFLGFACGLPYNLLGFSLSQWLRQCGFSLSVIGFFSLIFLPYSFKFLWAPFIDRIRIPVLSKIGDKKAWGVVFQAGLIACIIGLGVCAPDLDVWNYTYTKTDGETLIIPLQTFLFAFGVAFFAASQDIVVDALRIDTLDKDELGQAAGTYQLGYRLAALISGAGVVMASAYISWSLAYIIVGACCFLGMISLLCVKEPKRAKQPVTQHIFRQMVVDPFADFMKKNNWALLLIFIVLYKMCNMVLGRMASPFYIDVGFTKNQIGLISGTFGPWLTIFGVFMGGALVARFNVLKCLFGLGVVEILTSCAFAFLAFVGNSQAAFICTIIFDNIVGGMGGAVFIAFLSGLCSKNYSATQYALLTGFMSMSGSLIASYSGVWADQMGWISFFLFTGALMVPALMLLVVIMKRQKVL